MFQKSHVNITNCDVLIAGGGLAGLSAAIEAAKAGKNTLVVSKTHPLKSHSTAAAGGINAALTIKDFATHYNDTIEAGAGLCNSENVKILCQTAYEIIEQFWEWGVPFQIDEDHEFEGRPFGGSSQPRTRFVKDHTGLALMQALFQEAKKIGVSFFHDVFLIDLIKVGSRFVGAYGISFEKGTIEIFYSSAVILATGGAGALFEVNSNGVSSTGDGAAMALRGGLPLKNWELIQFHPTGMYPSGVLVSEAARGEGATLVNKNGESFMKGYHHLGDLAPRDVVTKAILTEIKKGKGFGSKGEFVALDCRNLSQECLERRLPEICDLAQTLHNIHPKTHLLPVLPTAHYFMGGVACDSEGRALDSLGFPVPGLWAVGECSCSGVHGANRLGGNSLLEAAVFGKRSGASAALQEPLSPPSPSLADDILASVQQLLEPHWRETPQKAAPSPLASRKELQKILTSYCGTSHSTLNHKQASGLISLLHKRFLTYTLKNSPSQKYNGELKDWLETKNLFFLADALLCASEERTESVGCFIRNERSFSGMIPYHTLVEWRRGQFYTERRNQ